MGWRVIYRLVIIKIYYNYNYFKSLFTWPSFCSFCTLGQLTKEEPLATAVLRFLQADSPMANTEWWRCFYKEIVYASDSCYLLTVMIANSIQLDVDCRPVVCSHLEWAAASNTWSHIARICIKRHRLESGRIIRSDWASDDIQQGGVGLSYTERWFSADHRRPHIQRTGCAVWDPVTVHGNQLLQAFQELRSVKLRQSRSLRRSKHSAATRKNVPCYVMHSLVRGTRHVQMQCWTFSGASEN